MNNTLRSTGDWKPEPVAEQFIRTYLEEALGACPGAAGFADLLLDRVAIRLRDLLDYICFDDERLIPALKAAGWREKGVGHYGNPLGWFPDFVHRPGKQTIYFRVEFVEDFLSANGITAAIEGQQGGPFRQARIFEGTTHDFGVVERHGYAGVNPEPVSESLIRVAKTHQQAFRARRRQFDHPEQGFDYTDQLVEAAVRDLGKDWSCALFLRAEREYWMTRNRAGRVQKERQDALGIGWANQDHHTYDSSRTWFYRTIRVLETLGFECRELFYAGAGAGWGSQILEQPVLQSVIFADIDLAPEELGLDFAHQTNIVPLHPYRRAGLWCYLHGESMLEAGLNHLECMYDSKRFNSQFEELNIPMMAPFSDFPHLYQALTVGEWWPVDPRRIDHLVEEGHITAEMGENFKMYGAIGSHFENLERNDGFKGFNQPGIDDVLRIIDPRKQLVEG